MMTLFRVSGRGRSTFLHERLSLLLLVLSLFESRRQLSEPQQPLHRLHCFDDGAWGSRSCSFAVGRPWISRSICMFSTGSYLIGANVSPNQESSICFGDITKRGLQVCKATLWSPLPSSVVASSYCAPADSCASSGLVKKYAPKWGRRLGITDSFRSTSSSLFALLQVWKEQRQGLNNRRNNQYNLTTPSHSTSSSPCFHCHFPCTPARLPLDIILRVPSSA